MQRTLSHTGLWGESRLSPTGPLDETFKSVYSSTYNTEAIARQDSTKQNEYAVYNKFRVSGQATLTKNCSKDELFNDGLNESSSALTLAPATNLHANLKHTAHLRHRSKDAPIAVGRSGARAEKGTSTSGLIGERLQLQEEPRLNSLVQRSWMYCEDPALRYRINGVPKAVMPTDVSLAIGYKPLDAHSDQPPEPWSWEHHRKSTITAEPNSRCINGREGGVKVFMDG